MSLFAKNNYNSDDVFMLKWSVTNSVQYLSFVNRRKTEL